MIELKFASLKYSKEILEMHLDNDFKKYYLSVINYNNLESVKKDIKNFKKLSINNNAFLFVILKNKEFVGTVDIWKTNKKHKRTCIGYGIKREFWKNGIATKAVKLALKFIKNDLKLHSVEATTHPKNIASKKVLLKNGFKKVGLMKDYYFDNNKFIDRELYWKIFD